MSKRRFLIKGTGTDKQAMNQALAKGIHSLNEIDDLVIVVPTFTNINHTIFADLLLAINPEMKKSLFKDRMLVLPERKKIQLCSSTTVKDFRRSQGFLVLSCNAKTIDEIETFDNCELIVALPWNEDEYQQWVSKFNPQII